MALGPICGETNPVHVRTPGPLGYNDAADPNQPLLEIELTGPTPLGTRPKTRGSAKRMSVADADTSKQKLAGNPNEGSKTTGNRIDIIFDPDKSSKVKKCKKIVHVQFMKYFADGKEIKPGDYSFTYKPRDLVTSKGGWVIDYNDDAKSPDYQQGTESGSNGSNIGGSVNATMFDHPTTSGGDPGFFDPSLDKDGSVKNKDGRKTIQFQFETYACCMQGPDCWTWYEGVGWEYNKSWEDHRDSKAGESKITNPNITTAPSQDKIDAFNLFNKKVGFKPCK